MKVVADSRGRLAAMQFFQPGKAFDISPHPDGGVVVVELVPKEVPTVRVKFKRDGSFECPRLMSRKDIRAAIRQDRDAQ